MTTSQGHEPEPLLLWADTPDTRQRKPADRAADLAALREALAGDGYGWLADRLGTPAPLKCPRCGTLMHPAAGLIVPACPQCYPGEVRRAGLRR